jgi:phosphatidylglycerophosphate synthase
MWLANLLTLARVPLGLLFYATFGTLAASIAVVAAAALTDALDGWVARRVRRRHTGAEPRRIGEWLDLVCDKFFVVTVLGTIWLELHPPAELLLLIAAREIVLVPLGLAYVALILVSPHVRYEFQAGVIGKAATVIQFAALLALLVDSPLVPALALAAGGLGIAAAAHYVLRASRLAVFTPPQRDPARHGSGSAPGDVRASGDAAILPGPWRPQTSGASSSTTSPSRRPSRS